jgi:hypothetical protein
MLEEGIFKVRKTKKRTILLVSSKSYQYIIFEEMCKVVLNNIDIGCSKFNFKYIIKENKYYYYYYLSCKKNNI